MNEIKFRFWDACDRSKYSHFGCTLSLDCKGKRYISNNIYIYIYRIYIAYYIAIVTAVGCLGGLVGAAASGKLVNFLSQRI